MLANLVSQSKHFRNCLTEIVLYLLDCVNTKFSDFQAALKVVSESSHKLRKGSIDSEYSIAVEAITAYNASINRLQKVLKVLDGALKNMGTKLKQINKKALMDDLNSLYSIEENPSK